MLQEKWAEISLPVQKKSIKTTKVLLPVQMKGIRLFYSQRCKITGPHMSSSIYLNHWLHWACFLRSNMQPDFPKLWRFAVHLESINLDPVHMPVLTVHVYSSCTYLVSGDVHCDWTMREELDYSAFWISLGLVAKQSTGCTAPRRKGVGLDWQLPIFTWSL